MIILHDPNHVRYGFEANPAYPQGWLIKIPSREFEPLQSLPHSALLGKLKKLFRGCQPHPKGEYTVFLELTHSPRVVGLYLLHGLRATPEIEESATRVLIRISQFIQMYPGSDRTRDKERWEGSTFEKDLNILSRKILQEFLLDLEARGIWRMWNQDLDKAQPLPEQIVRQRTLPRTIARPRRLASGTEIRLTDLTGPKT